MPDGKRDRYSPRRPIRLLVCALAVWIAPLLAGVGFDINTADAVALAAELPGIGPVKAGRIVAHRDAHGPFVDLDALIAVPGIGPKTLESIRRHLGGASPPSSSDERRDRLDGVRAPTERNDRGVSSAPAPPAGRAPASSTSELEAEARVAVRELVELARADAARPDSTSRPLAPAVTLRVPGQ